jgi:signal transduction histidine kinase
MAGWQRLRRWDVATAFLVVPGMAVFVAGVFIAVVRGGGAVLGQTRTPHPALSVLATAIVALGFEPVRRWLRPLAAGLVHGARPAPYDLLTAGYATDGVPARMARLLAQATGARYAEVWLVVDGSGVPVATWPASAQAEARADAGASADTGSLEDAIVPGRRTLPVRRGDELLGHLVVGERSGHPLTPVEERLFAGLAAQAGLALHAVAVRAELTRRLAESGRRAAELRAARERIVAAEDEERRRLERDIHDGAQQHLVALAVQLRLARTLVARGSPRAASVVADLVPAAQDAIDTIADLSRGIYPRLLADGGLRAALAAALPARSGPMDLVIDDLGPVPRDVEAAVYFCCLEALQNAAKHAGPARVSVRITRRSGRIDVIVADDGRGFVAAAAAGAGRGLVNMRDRVEALGGALQIAAAPGHGTVVTARVPVAEIR